jgi:hypothetical protein
VTTPTPSVALAGGASGSSFFHLLLLEAARRFPAAFKKGYAEALTRFEAARLASAERLEIARFLRSRTLESLTLGEGRRLTEALREPAAPPQTATREPSMAPDFTVEIPLDGTTWRGAEAHRAVDKLERDHHLTAAAAQGLRWIIDRGPLDLRGHRFVLLGGNAEMAPTPLLLRAGATVRWIDVRPPLLPDHAGCLVWSKEPDDVLAAPQALRAAIEEFAAQGPVHLGLFAYAPGQGREVRLAAAMDAIAGSLSPASVASIALFVSPTSPAEVQREDLAEAGERAASLSLFHRAAKAARVLVGPGQLGGAARSVVSLQGASYQAAQYLSKELAGEVLAADGLGGKPVTLSFNVAGITRTRSLAHPLFLAAFEGAAQFGVRIFEPATTRAVSGLLLLHDLLNPQAPAAAGRTYPSALERVRASKSEQVHGGVYCMPWQLESALRVAAVTGLLQRPGLLLRRR